MSRSIHATTPSGDEVTLEANAQLGAHGRNVAQMEHNAMQALDLVRAALAALADISPRIDRAGLLLSHSAGLTQAAANAELRRSIEQLGASIHGANLHDDPLLQGGGKAFALQHPTDQVSEPLQVELPELGEPFRALASVDVRTENSATLAQRHAALLQTAQLARRHLTLQAQRLSEGLAMQRRKAPRVPAGRRAEDEGFVTMIQQVRDSVLGAGDAALRVQGSPSGRAAWLIEALDPNA